MFLRTVSRAVPRSTAAIRVAPASVNAIQTRAASDHAIANPTLASIEKRWEGMPPQEQAELWMQLRDRMKVDWHQLTQQEKKAAYYIAFGAHGPRAQAPKGEGWRVLSKVVQLTAASVAIFYAVHAFAGKQPATMSKEWQEASNEYALKEKINPIHGISKEGYEGKGFVQSPLPRSHRCTGPTGNEAISEQDGRRHPYDIDVDFLISSSGHVHHVYLPEDGPSPVRAALDNSLFLSPLASIRQCVYPVLCYHQCISFVAIENMFSSIFVSLYLVSCWCCGPPVGIRMAWCVYGVIRNKT
ncbi:hypothetical protein N7467_000324 [Penicillium canescens]|nr:hypothetical protein N7467_000324 [Penicillium canescens]